LRKDKNAKGPRMFEPEKLRAILAATGTQLKAMLLLGVNCGFGNADCGNLPIGALDLTCGWVSFPRPKAGAARRVPLWPETVAALRVALAARPAPKCAQDAQLVFITKYGTCWAKRTCDNPVSKETAKLLKSLGICRQGLNFYALRHTFETIGGETRDQVAVDHIMGHARDDMASLYRERISDERLRAVTDFVHRWLFAMEEGASGE
jgi:integrase